MTTPPPARSLFGWALLTMVLIVGSYLFTLALDRVVDELATVVGMKLPNVKGKLPQHGFQHGFQRGLTDHPPWRSPPPIA